jgi:GTP-binding protein
MDARQTRMRESMTTELDKPVVAIVGRPNVGKSTLFNRILRQRLAIVDDQPGVTRDRLYGEASWGGRQFVLIDTGGYVPETEDLIEQAVREQVQYAVEEATVILFVCDAQTGVTPLDQQIALDLSRRGKPVLLVVNKADSEQREMHSYEFYRLGMGDPLPISASLGRRVGDLLDRLVALLPPARAEGGKGAETDSVRIAVVGRPNVGKSSFINAILGHPKLLVTEVPGTTRDSVDTLVEYRGRKITLIDTAGLRRRSRIKEAVEFYSVVRTHRAIRRSEVVILMIGADEGLTAQDKRILEEILEAKRGAVLVVNKWDLLEKNRELAEKYQKALQEELRIYSYVPIAFTSALTNWQVSQVLDLALQVWAELRKRVETHEVNRFLQEALAAYPPPAYGAKYVKIKYASQVATAPPVFAFFCNIPKGIKPSYRQYLENRLRERFGFQGVPLVLTFRRK